MQIVHDIAGIHKDVDEEKRVRPVYRQMQGRSNNCRKSTKGRRNQYITYQVNNTWPPKLVTKLIRHSK
jgi:hypothetical protein